MEEKITVSEGVSVGVMFVTIGLLVLFLWSPTAHFLGKWNAWWSEPEGRPETSTEVKVGEYTWKNYQLAYEECRERAHDYFGNAKVAILASSTVGDYEKYDCWGLKYTKI